MYEKDFGLRRRPYPATPDRAFYYPATTHESALALLQRALAEEEGFALLVGAPGTGKTLLGHCLLDRLGPSINSAFLTNSHFADRAGFLQAILYDFSLPYEDGQEQVLRLRLTDFLLKNHGAGQRTLLLLDEAQHLSADLLEELRLLGNLEGDQGKAFQVILLAQEKILETLKRPELASVRQRLPVRGQLEPLGVEEAVDYLVHHVRVAGGRPETIWDETSLEILARGTKGIPRLLNQAAHQALVLAYQAEMNRVDAEAALEALAVLGLAGSSAEETAGNKALAGPASQESPVLGLMETEEYHDSPAPALDQGVCRLFDSPRPA